MLKYLCRIIIQTAEGDDERPNDAAAGTCTILLFSTLQIPRPILFSRVFEFEADPSFTKDMIPT